MPPLISAGLRCSKPRSPTSSSFIFIIMLMMFSSSVVCSRMGSATFSPTVMEL